MTEHHDRSAGTIEATDLIERMEAMERGEGASIPLAKVIGTLKRMRDAAQSSQVRLATIEECAQIAEPKGPRPCDCESGHCYCHNQGDAMAVASWDADMAVANAIRALAAQPPAAPVEADQESLRPRKAVEPVEAASRPAPPNSSAETEEIAEARRLEIGEGIFIAAWEIEDIRKIGVLSTRVDVPMGARMQCHCCLKWTSTYYMRLTCWICPDCEQLVTGKTMSRLGVDAMTASAETEGLLAEFFSHSAIDEAMQDAWNDICTDTGCHPLDIEHGRGKHLTFKPSHWANQIAKRLFLRAVKVQLKADAEIGNHLPDLPQTVPGPISANAETAPQSEIMGWKAEAERRFGPIPDSGGENARLIAGYHYAFVEGAKAALSLSRPQSETGK